MGALVWLFVLLAGAAAILFGAGIGPFFLACLFAVNVAAGYTFWTRRRVGRLGRKSVAVVYLASGISFFAILVDEVMSDTVPDLPLPAAAATATAAR